MHRRLIQLALPYRGQLLLSVGCAVLVGLCGLGQAYSVSSTVDAVFLGRQSLPQVWPWLRLLLLVIVSRGLLNALHEVAASNVSIRVRTSLRERLFARLLDLGPSYCRNARTGELTTTVVEGVQALDPYFSQFLPQLMVSALVPALILVVVFRIDPLSGAILLLTAPLIPFFMYMIGRGAEVAARDQFETLSRLSAHFLDSLQGLTTLKLFGQSRAQVRNIASVCEQFRAATMRVMQVSFLSAFALELAATISTAIIAVEVGLRLLHGLLPFRQALFVLILAPDFYLPLRMLGVRFHAGIAGTAAARRIFSILDTHASAPAAMASVPPAPVLPGHDACRRDVVNDPIIKLSSVSYSYPNEARLALDAINMSIRPGEHVAIVGPSGAGKSTLVNLLLGFIQPTRGEIAIAGLKPGCGARDSRGIPIAWVPQRPHLFHDSIAANIRLGRPLATPDEVADAARKALLTDVIEGRPGRYMAVIGEAGGRLSDGEAQRLALARAFLVQAPILILDEPTSRLDPENERLLAESISSRLAGRTVITIAHRLNTIYRADRIFVLEAGRLVECGTPAQLATRDGYLARMLRVGVGQEPENDAPGGRQTQTRAAAFYMGSMPMMPPPALAADEALSAYDANLDRSVLGRLLGFLRGLWGWIGLGVCLSSLTIASSVALMGTSAWLISAAALYPSIAELELAIVGVRFFGIARAAFRYIERLVSHNVTFRLLSNIRVWFYSRLEPLAPARLMDRRAGDLLGRAVADVETLESFFIRVLAPPLTAVLVGVGCSAFLALTGAPGTALVLSLFFLLTGIALPLLIRRLSLQGGPDIIRQRAQMNMLLVDGIQGLPDVLAFGRGSDHLSAIRLAGKRLAEAQRSTARFNALQIALSGFLANLAMWFVLVLAVGLVSGGSLPGIMLAPITLISLASFEATAPLPLAAQLWPSVQEAARRLFEIVDAEPLVSDAPETDTGLSRSHVHSESVGGVHAGLDLDVLGVSFTYPGAARPALRDVSFRLPAGGRLGIVGSSGAGKSSLINVLLRFWDVDRGEICIDGRSLRALSPDDVRARFSVVSPKAYFFDSTIYENLRLARRGATRAEIARAVEQAELSPVLQRLPNGYDSLIGEHGLRLSAGERQRLALARAFIRRAPILILDEPTADLDVVTEARILDSLRTLMEGTTTLFITHRLVGLQDLDEILVMEAGAVVERGRADDLRRLHGTYRRLLDTQNRILEPLV